MKTNLVFHHTAEAISKALQKMLAYFSEQYSSVFKTITADNGSEFADLSLVENGKTKVYFTHPYSSFEKGTVECHNRMFRRFIPKGKSIDDYTADDICFFADSINGLPRKILGYKTGKSSATKHRKSCLSKNSTSFMPHKRWEVAGADVGFLRSGFALSPQSNIILR